MLSSSKKHPPGFLSPRFEQIATTFDNVPAKGEPNHHRYFWSRRTYKKREPYSPGQSASTPLGYVGPPAKYKANANAKQGQRSWIPASGARRNNAIAPIRGPGDEGAEGGKMKSRKKVLMHRCRRQTNKRLARQVVSHPLTPHALT